MINAYCSAALTGFTYGDANHVSVGSTLAALQIQLAMDFVACERRLTKSIHQVLPRKVRWMVYYGQKRWHTLVSPSERKTSGWGFGDLSSTIITSH